MHLRMWPDCSLRVGNETRQVAEGKAWVSTIRSGTKHGIAAERRA